ncbi:uncharacterized protein LOC122366685 isoform X1 [Amphibalanus amphitrite]|uniref:uncharacterized protein LOC122366685 isoform X1 n=1 Tax=Amphibalanus amphitrite TaxID=1232801 RepID=UPI001C90AEF3|nr:uncharacterized protein LOC122366685 isoform X1 [Amphibalanus amphitrite]
MVKASYFFELWWSFGAVVWAWRSQSSSALQGPVVVSVSPHQRWTGDGCQDASFQTPGPRINVSPEWHDRKSDPPTSCCLLRAVWPHRRTRCMPGKEKETAFLFTIDSGMDVLNSGHPRDAKTLRRGCSGTPGQEDALSKLVEEVEGLRFGSAGHLLPFQKGLVVTVKVERGPNPTTTEVKGRLRLFTLIQLARHGPTACRLRVAHPRRSRYQRRRRRRGQSRRQTRTKPTRRRWCAGGGMP